MKKCSKCGEEKPLGDFYKDKRAPDGLYSCCKVCHYVKTERYRRRNADALRAGARRRRAANLEKHREKDRQWRLRNPAAAAAAKQRYRQRHPDRITAYNKRYYLRDAENQRARSAKYRAEHPETIKAQRKPELLRRYRERRRAKLLDAFVADVAFDDILQRDEGRCGICGEPVVGPLELDHILPLAAGGTHEPDNVQLAHRTCNRRKHARTDYAA